MNDKSENNKRIAKNTLMLYIRMFFIMLVSLYTSRVVLDVLGVTDYGIYNVVAGFVTLLAFITSSLANVTQRYLNIGLGKNDLNITNKYFSQSLIIYAIVSLILILVGETVGVWFIENKLVIPVGRENVAFWTFQLSLLAAVISILQTPYTSAIIAREQMNIYAYIGLLEAGLKLATALLLIAFGDDGKVVLYSAFIAISYLITAIIYFIYCRKKFPECTFRFYWDAKLIKEMANFVGCNLFGSFAYSACTQGANIILNIFFGTVANAARGIAVQVSSTAIRFTDSILSAVKPQIIKSYTANDIGYVENLIRKSSVYTFLMMLILIIPLSFNTQFILNIWLKKVPAYSILFTQLALIEALFAVMAMPLWLAANATGNIKRSQVYGRGFMMLSLPASYFLLRFCQDPYIPSVSLICANIFFWLFSIYDIHKQLELNLRRYTKEVIIPSCIISAITYACIYAEVAAVHTPWLRFIVTTLSSILIVPLLAYHITLNREQRIEISYKIRNRLKKQHS